MRKFLPLVLLICSLCWANTPPTRVGCVASSGTSSTTSKASGSLTWQSGDYIIVMGAGAGSQTNSSFNTPTATGLTFSILASNGASSAHAEAVVASAVAGANGSSTITLGMSVSEFYNFAACAWRGVTGLGTPASLIATSTLTGVSLTSTQADSAIMWLDGDWSAGATSRTGKAGASNASNTDVAILVSGQSTTFVWDFIDQPSTSAVTYGISGTATNNQTFYAIEIKGTTGGGGTVNCTLALMGAGPC